MIEWPAQALERPAGNQRFRAQMHLMIVTQRMARKKLPTVTVFLQFFGRVCKKNYNTWHDFPAGFYSILSTSITGY
jgi:hypothetical protein